MKKYAKKHIRSYCLPKRSLKTEFRTKNIEDSSLLWYDIGGNIPYLEKTKKKKQFIDHTTRNAILEPKEGLFSTKT